jgi:hypothetical protein
MEILGDRLEFCNVGRSLSLFSVRRYSGAKREIYTSCVNSETSILYRRELPALRAGCFYPGMFEELYEFENQISVVQSMNNSKTFIEDSVFSYHFK